ncbi:MAG: hypothetical protein ACX932_04070, partial [Gammaproteobacteria bacterium]
SSTKQKISSIVTITDFLSGVFLVEKRKSIIIRKSVLLINPYPEFALLGIIEYGMGSFSFGGSFWVTGQLPSTLPVLGHSKQGVIVYTYYCGI